MKSYRTHDVNTKIIYIFNRNMLIDAENKLINEEAIKKLVQKISFDEQAEWAIAAVNGTTVEEDPAYQALQTTLLGKKPYYTQFNEANTLYTYAVDVKGEVQISLKEEVSDNPPDTPTTDEERAKILLLSAFNESSNENFPYVVSASPDTKLILNIEGLEISLNYNKFCNHLQTITENKQFLLYLFSLLGKAKLTPYLSSPLGEFGIECIQTPDDYQCLDTHNIIFIDNESENCLQAEKMGFTVIRSTDIYDHLKTLLSTAPHYQYVALYDFSQKLNENHDLFNQNQIPLQEENNQNSIHINYALLKPSNDNYENNYNNDQLRQANTILFMLPFSDTEENQAILITSAVENITEIINTTLNSKPNHFPINIGIIINAHPEIKDLSPLENLLNVIKQKQFAQLESAKIYSVDFNTPDFMQQFHNILINIHQVSLTMQALKNDYQQLTKDLNAYISKVSKRSGIRKLFDQRSITKPKAAKCLSKHLSEQTDIQKDDEFKIHEKDLTNNRLGELYKRYRALIEHLNPSHVTQTETPKPTM